MVTELELLQQIDRLHQWLLQEPNGRFEHGMRREPDGDMYFRKADELFQKVVLLRNTYHPDCIDILDQHIGSIYSHELSSVRSSYDISRRSNARQRDKERFIATLNEANDSINRHLTELFTHIEEINRPTINL